MIHEDHRRQTGRTTRMLLRALLRTGFAKNVVISGFNHHYANDLMYKFIKIAEACGYTVNIASHSMQAIVVDTKYIFDGAIGDREERYRGIENIEFFDDHFYP